MRLSESHGISLAFEGGADPQQPKLLPGLVLRQPFEKEGDFMFRTVLVPLDGSPFSEQSLPHALGIVRRAGGVLDLVHVHVLHVMEEHMVARYSFDPAIDEEHRRQEQLYLEGTAKWLAAVSPVPVTTA